MVVNTMAISVIIPVFNEEKAIVRTLTELGEVLEEFGNYEIIVVDDGSNDKSFDRIKSFEGRNLRIISHVENLGYGKSLWDGIKSAENDCIAIIDADGTYPVKYIKELYEHYPTYDMVVAARRGKEYDSGIFKGPARRIFKWMAEYSTGRKIPDINSGLRLFDRNIVMGFEDPLCAGFSFTTTITLLFFFNNHFVKYVPVDYLKRKGTSKVNNFKDSLRAGQIIVETVLYYNPLKLFLLMAMINVLFGLLLGIINSIFWNVSFFSITAAICVSSFIPVFCIGLVATQIRRLFWKRKSQE